MNSGVDSNERVHPILVDSSGRAYARLTDGTNEPIFDTDDNDIAKEQTTLTIINLNYVWDATNDKWIRSTPSAALTEISFYSDPVSFMLNSTAADQALGDVVIPNISGYTIEAAYATMLFDGFHNSAGAVNGLEADEYIQADLSAAGYINAIKLIDSCFESYNDTRYRGGLFHGSYDISSRVDWNSTTNFKWASADVEQNNMYFFNVVTGIRLLIYPS